MGKTIFLGDFVIVTLGRKGHYFKNLGEAKNFSDRHCINFFVLFPSVCANFVFCQNYLWFYVFCQLIESSLNIFFLLFDVHSLPMYFKLYIYLILPVSIPSTTLYFSLFILLFIYNSSISYSFPIKFNVLLLTLNFPAYYESLCFG